MRAQTSWAAKNAIWNEMYQWFRGQIYEMMGGENDGMERYYVALWEKIILSKADLTREKVEEWLVDLMRCRQRMYEIGYYRAAEGPEKELRDLAARIPKDTLLRQWFAQQCEPKSFDDFYHIVQGWCKTRNYLKVETTQSELQVLGAEVDEAEDDVVEVDNLNATRTARAPLPGGKTPRPAQPRVPTKPKGQGRGQQSRPDRCAACGGQHRLRRCPNELAEKDHEFQKKLAANANTPSCDYKDPKGFHICGGQGHWRSHHNR